MRVVAALSGGVDSAVAAARLIDAGHDVVGVHLALAREAAVGGPGSRGCCSIEDSRDARRVADVLGIPYFVWDMSERFMEDVIDDFVAEYAAGRTPNPCVRCNERIKFAAVLERAQALGFDAVGTGHYARIETGARGAELHRSVDPEKDQSYVLAVINADQLAGALFPLGDSHKDEVRAEAKERGLLVADKPDSHDICFIPTGDTAAFLRKRLGPAEADIVDAESGEVLGHTDVAYALTIGQRRGLDLRRPASDGQPRYVVDVDLSTARVQVGPRSALAVTELVGDHVRWCGPVEDGEVHGHVQVRAHGEPVPATAVVRGDDVEVLMAEPIFGVAAGQTLVMYSGTRAVLSATIKLTAHD